MSHTQQRPPRQNSPDEEQNPRLDFSFPTATVEKAVFQKLDENSEDMYVILPHENNHRSRDSVPSAVSLSKKSGLSGAEGATSSTSNLPAVSSVDRGLRCLLSPPMAPSILPSPGKVGRLPSKPKEIEPKNLRGEKWQLHYKEFLAFVKEKGHAHVPQPYPENPKLVNWVRRQRRLYKNWVEGKPTAMTEERLNLLTSAGFIFDSHELKWRENLSVLDDYRRRTGNSNVPTNYIDKKLAIWVKNQRRDYKLFSEGKTTAMSRERISELEKRGFAWDIYPSSKEPKSLPIPHLPIKYPCQTNPEPRIPTNLHSKMSPNLQPRTPKKLQPMIQPNVHPGMKFSMVSYPMLDFSIPDQVHSSVNT